MRSIFAVALVLIVSLCGCKSEDEKARILHNQAITANREGRGEEAVKLLNEIVAKYPSTQTAVEANQSLAAKEAFSTAISDATKETRRQTIDMALKLYYLDNGQLPTTEQGIQALKQRPTTGTIPRGWRDGGYVENGELLDIVTSYESDGRTYKLKIQ